jgi:arylsulfatase A-like enzyme
MFRSRKLVLRSNVPVESAEKAIEDLRGYYAHIAALDDCFKQLLDTLKETSSEENTIVVFTSDHGDMMHSQGLQYKSHPWEESIRVPLLIRYPAKFGKVGKRCAAPVSSPDLMPTLLGIAGIAIPDGVQGTNYAVSVAVDSAQTAGVSAFLNLPATRWRGFAEYRGVRTSRHTYVRTIKGPWLLYDNAVDPYQMHNLCGKVEVKAIQQQLDAELRRWLARLDDQFLTAPEYWRRDRLDHYFEANLPWDYVRSPWGDWESSLAKPRGLSLRTPEAQGSGSRFRL